MTVSSDWPDGIEQVDGGKVAKFLGQAAVDSIKMWAVQGSLVGPSLSPGQEARMVCVTGMVTTDGGGNVTITNPKPFTQSLLGYWAFGQFATFIKMGTFSLNQWGIVGPPNATQWLAVLALGI